MFNSRKWKDQKTFNDAIVENGGKQIELNAVTFETISKLQSQVNYLMRKVASLEERVSNER